MPKYGIATHIQTCCRLQPKAFLVFLHRKTKGLKRIMCMCMCVGRVGQGQHGEADLLRPLSSGEVGPYCRLPVGAFDPGAQPSPLRVSDQQCAHRHIHTGTANLCRTCRYVCIALEAMEQLLLACHCQSINLLVESFLSTLRLLLEADNKPHLHILATNSVSNAHACTHARTLRCSGITCCCQVRVSTLSLSPGCSSTGIMVMVIHFALGLWFMVINLYSL